MKKLMILGALMALGVTAMGASENVTVKAEVVSDNLEISDLAGRPLVLDFGKISSIGDQVDANAKIDFKVTRVGDTVTAAEDLVIGLLDTNADTVDADPLDTILLAHVNPMETDTLEATVALDSLGGTIGKDSGSVYQGTIRGNIAMGEAEGKPVGHYEKIIILNVTTTP